MYLLRFFNKRQLAKKEKSGRRDSNPRPSAWKANALSTELLPHYLLWARMDSNHRRRKPADLQSAPFGHSGTCPIINSEKQIKRAETRDPQLGRLMLYQLSYFRISNLWARMDSNHRRRKPADLQSAPFGHSGICPSCTLF